MRFATCREAERAIEMVMGRSWGGRMIYANMAKFQSIRGEGSA